jgi:DNA-binding transcriptional MerR regulator
MKDTSSLRIGELAACSGRSVHAIRWYEAQGLIPGVIRDAAGRRVFTPRHVEWLALVERLRNTGMSIAGIRAYTQLVTQGRSSVDRQRDLLAAHRDAVSATIDAWQASLDLIDAKLAFYARWIETGERPASEPVLGKYAAAAGAKAGKSSPAGTRPKRTTTTPPSAPKSRG